MTVVLIAVSVFVAAKYGWPLGIAVLVISWLGHSYLFPWTACAVCGGSPRHTDGSGRNYNIFCPACRGRGRRRRFGSRLLRGGFGQM